MNTLPGGELEGRRREVHRLAVEGRRAGIARRVGQVLCQGWLAVSRFEEVRRVSSSTLSLGHDAGAFNDLGRALYATGDRAGALESYGQALRLYRQVGDRAGEATTLNNIGSVHQARGDLDQALDLFGQALPLHRQVGDRAGEATTLTDIGRVHRARGDR
ncbi:MAG: hypothetical protein QG608_199, partial [Actinomycetota bacterium]|nr:hypothetical protein [Actinomycetota bacterium]